MSGHNLVYVMTREEAIDICKCSAFTYEPLYAKDGVVG